MQLSNKQKEFIKNCNHRYNIKTGATRSGKTYLDLLYTIPSRIRERAGKKGLNVILGVTNSTIERNVLQPMRELYGDRLVGTINSQNIAKLFGEEVYCLGAEKVSQVSKIRGASIKYCYCDELAEYNQEVFELLKSRLDKEYSVLDGALNPESPTHWLKEFLDSNADIYEQQYTIFDNPFLPKEFVDNLCKEYEGTVYYNRYILGQWCNAEGIIFTPIADNPKRYILPEKYKDKDGKEISNVISGIICIGIDWGGNGSSHSITASTIARDYSQLQVLASDKMVATGTNTKQVFRWINDFVQKIVDTYGLPQGIFCDSAEQVLNNSLRSELKFNIPILDSIKTPIEERIKCLIRLLNSDRISFIDKDTNSIVTALQTALYDEKSQTDRWIDDGKTSDIDSLDSFVYSWEKWMNQLMIKKEAIK